MKKIISIIMLLLCVSLCYAGADITSKMNVNEAKGSYCDGGKITITSTTATVIISSTTNIELTDGIIVNRGSYDIWIDSDTHVLCSRTDDLEGFIIKVGEVLPLQGKFGGSIYGRSLSGATTIYYFFTSLQAIK